MASTNFLTVKTHLSEFKQHSDKDTLSEVSILSFYIRLITNNTHNTISAILKTTALLHPLVTLMANLVLEKQPELWK